MEYYYPVRPTNIKLCVTGTTVTAPLAGADEGRLVEDFLYWEHEFGYGVDNEAALRASVELYATRMGYRLG